MSPHARRSWPASSCAVACAVLLAACTPPGESTRPPTLGANRASPSTLLGHPTDDVLTALGLGALDGLEHTASPDWRDEALQRMPCDEDHEIVAYRGSSAFFDDLGLTMISRRGVVEALVFSDDGTLDHGIRRPFRAQIDSWVAQCPGGGDRGVFRCDGFALLRGAQGTWLETLHTSERHPEAHTHPLNNVSLLLATSRRHIERRPAAKPARLSMAQPWDAWGSSWLFFVEGPEVLERLDGLTMSRSALAGRERWYREKCGIEAELLEEPADHAGHTEDIDPVCPNHCVVSFDRMVRPSPIPGDQLPSCLRMAQAIARDRAYDSPHR